MDGIDIGSNIDDKIFIVKEPIMFLNEIQELMKQNAGIIREETKLKIGLKRILELKKEFYSKDKIIKEFTIDPENIVLTWEVKSSLVICEAIIKVHLCDNRAEELITALIFQILMMINGR